MSLDSASGLMENYLSLPEEFAMDKPEVLSVTQAANVLGCSRATCYRWVREGRIPALHVGRRILIPRKALEDWLASAIQR